MERANINPIRRAGAAALLLLALLSAGCEKDTGIEEPGPANPFPGETVTTTLRLSQSLAPEIVVRSVTGADENIIKDLWVIQFDPADNALLHPVQYIDGLTAAGGTYEVRCQLSAVHSRICLIANTHDATLYSAVTSGTDVQTVTTAVTAEGDLASADGIPMAGVWTGTPGESVAVSLTRAVAKLNFSLSASLPAGDTYTLQSVAVRQVPTILHPYRDPATLTAGTYPALTAASTFSYAPEILNGQLDATERTLMWYLPENARGTGSATSQFLKNADNAPAGQGDCCTYIEVNGTYHNAITSTDYFTRYRIFLGADNTSDYNVLRGRNYTLTTVIRGQTTADTRIELFDGFDYTDNGMPSFLTALSDLSGKMDWTTAQTCCPSGWRVPSQDEMMLMSIYRSELGTFADNAYWSATEYNSSEVWLGDFLHNAIVYSTKDDSFFVRCVKDLAPGGTKYPYIDGMTIVNRDAIGGVKPSLLHPSWAGQPTPAHNERHADNAVAAKFEFAAADCNSTNSPGVDSSNTNYTWANAALACAAYTQGGGGTWRLPTQRELMQMWVFRASLGLRSPVDHWSATGYDSNTNRAWFVSFANGYTNWTDKNDGYPVRCVRDI